MMGERASRTNGTRGGAGAVLTRIKTCGMSRPEDIEAVNAARPDACGFVVDFPKSRRSVSLDALRALVGRLDGGILAVGVFVDEDSGVIARLAADGLLDAVQLHGHEDAAYIADLRERLAGLPSRLDAGRPPAIIQALKVRDASDVAAANASRADLVLLDNGQGTGEAFDWSLLAGVARPYVLAGGLTPESIPEAIEALHPFAVDLSSGLETGSIKDPAKIRAAVAATRQASG